MLDFCSMKRREFPIFRMDDIDILDNWEEILKKG